VRANVGAAAWTPTADDLDALRRIESDTVV
jgi:hypothetical protein